MTLSSLLPRCLVFVCAWFVLFAPCVHAAPDNDNSRALAAYRSGDLETARSAWTNLLAQAPSVRERGRLCYDLGNVAFREKKVLEAIGWYTASLRLCPRDADAWANLEHARGEAKLDPADRGDLGATLERLLSSMTLAECEWLALACALLWAATLAYEALRGGVLARRLALSATFLLAVTLVPWIHQRSRAAQDRELAIAPQPLALLSEPRADAAHLGDVAPGDEVERIDELGDWVKVETDAGVLGWALRSGVFALKR